MDFPCLCSAYTYFFFFLFRLERRGASLKDGPTLGSRGVWALSLGIWNGMAHARVFGGSEGWEVREVFPSTFILPGTVWFLFPGHNLRAVPRAIAGGKGEGAVRV